MKRIFHYFAIAAIMLAAAACELPDPDNPNGSEINKPDKPDNPDNPDTPSGPYFKLLNSLDDPVAEGQEVIFNRDASGTTFIVQTNIDDWNATASEEWCDVHTDENGNLVVLTPEYGEWNEMLPPRIGIVTVTASNGFKRTIYIIQQSSTYIDFPRLEFDNALWSKKLPLAPAGETVDVLILTNSYRWIPSTDVSWLKLDVVDISTLRVTSYPDSGSGSGRRGTVTLTVASDQTNKVSFVVVDGNPAITGIDYEYGERSDWD